VIHLSAPPFPYAFILLEVEQ